MAWSDGGAWSTKTFSWDSLNLEIWDGSHGPWSDDVEAWNGFAAAASFALSVGVAAPEWEVHQFGSMSLGVGMGKSVAVEAHGAPSVSFPLEVNQTSAGVVDAAAPVSFSLGVAVPIAIEAHAAPSDVDDAWLVADGAWNDAGGGAWDQPGGTPLRMSANVLTSGGLDATEALTIELGMSQAVATEAHGAPSAVLSLTQEYTAAGTAEAAGTLTLGVNESLSVPVEAWAVPSELPNDSWGELGSWDDAAGGPWNQPGGPRLNSTLNLSSLGGLDAVEAITLSANVELLSNAEATAVPAAVITTILDQASVALTTAEAAATLGAIGNISSATRADLVGAASLNLQPGLNLFGGFLFDAEVTFTLAPGILADRERLAIWIEDGEFDVAWLEELALSTIWLGAPFQDDLWTELAEINALWLEELMVAAGWTSLAIADSVWTKALDLSGTWQTGVAGAASWTKQTGANKEWS